MSCDRLGERWYTDTVDALLQDAHVGACPECQARLDRVIAADDALRSHVGAAPGRPTERPVRTRSAKPLWWGLIAVAAAAVLGVALWQTAREQGAPQTPRTTVSSAPEDLYRAFEAIDHAPGLRDTEKLSDALTVHETKTAALQALEEALVEPCASEDPGIRGPCEQSRGKARAEMARWLLEAPGPGDLSEGSRTVYDQALGREAQAQQDLAREAFEASLDAAEEMEEPSWKEAVMEDLAELDKARNNSVQEQDEIELELERLRSDGRAIARLVEEDLDRLRAEAKRCAGTPLAEELAMVVEQTSIVIEAEEWDMVRDIATMVHGYVDNMPLCD